MENVTQLDWSEDKYKNGDDVPKTLLDDTVYIDRIIPSCNPENSCEIIQDFLKDDDDSFSIYREARREYQDAMTTCENRIEQFKQDIRTEIQEISIHQQRYNEALQTYLK